MNNESGQQPVPLASPDVGVHEEELILEVLRSGALSLGPMLGRFEQDFATFVGAERAVAVSSGTAGLHLAIRAAGIAAGQEVITSPFSFIASANVMIYERAKPVFVDIDPVTLNIDPNLIEGAINERTCGILPVHIFGAPAGLDQISKIAQASGLWIVEDACEALGTKYPDGKYVGASGNPTVFGFYPNKQMTTGEGGMVTLPNGGAADIIASERNQGRAPDMGWLDHDRLGFNYRMSDLQAALGVAQVERISEILDQRATVAAWYYEQLADSTQITLPTDQVQGTRSWFVYVIQMPSEQLRDRAIELLQKQGIASKPYLPAIHLQPFYRKQFGYGPGDFPVAEDAAARSLALPFFTRMSKQQVSRVSQAVRGLVS